MTGGVMCSLPVQNGQVSTWLRVSRGAGSSAFFGRMLRAVATSTDSLGTMGLMRISRTTFSMGVVMGRQLKTGPLAAPLKTSDQPIRFSRMSAGLSTALEKSGNFDHRQRIEFAVFLKLFRQKCFSLCLDIRAEDFKISIHGHPAVLY